MTDLRVELLTIPGAPLGDENPLPFFRDPQQDLPARALPSMAPEQCEHFGVQAGFRVLPYRMQDSYTRARRPLTFHALVLENAYLSATFLPELGGRLYSLRYLPGGRELLARNPVFQPANLAIRNAWFSGGIEWNISQFGHTFGTCAPLFAAAIQGPAGEPGLRLYEFERCKRLLWQIDCYLPPDSPLLIVYTRIVNPNDSPAWMYWWTNIAVPEAPDVRVLAAADQVLYLDDFRTLSFGAAEMPVLPSLPERDASYATNFPFANEYFFQCNQAAMPWQAALDRQGTGLFEASTPQLGYRKLFCWGTHAGGRRWQEFLSEPGHPYIEIQAGLAPTQLHSQPMPPQAVWDWTQVFGYLAADPEQTHSPDWPTARRSTQHAIEALIAPARLAAIEAGCRLRADAPPRELLHTGAGWGALELARRAAAGSAGWPGAFVFPPATLGREQARWLALLHDGRLPEQSAQLPPGEWMTQPEWATLLTASLANPANRNWYALLHAGVIALECGDEPGAELAWIESIAQVPSAWAYRNLAVLACRRGHTRPALGYYGLAWDLAVAGGDPPAGLAHEYLQLLCAEHQFDLARVVYLQLPEQQRNHDRIRIVRGRMALALGDLATVEQVLEYEYADIREGESELTDLWFELWARREAATQGRPLDATLRAEVELRHPPPQRIDYRMKND
ncbi:MAG: DUF5107 domain-containing protein [Kouleothrix sp.]